MRIFLIAAIVLIVFGIIAAASSTGLLFSTAWQIWFMSSFLAYLVDILAGGWIVAAFANQRVVTTQARVTQ